MKTSIKRGVAAGTLVVAGFGAGAAVAVTTSASAATDTAGSDGSSSSHSFDPSKSVRPDEHLLTGTTAAKVRAAALAKYPGATVQRVETDSEGVYEAHIVTRSGSPLVVAVNKSHTVTGTQEMGRPGDGHGPGDGDGPPGPPPSGAPQSSPPSSSGSASGSATG